MAKMVTLATNHPDMEEKELFDLFTKRLDIVSNIWLFVVGFIVGYVSTFATSILNLTSVASTLWKSYPYLSLLFIFIIGLALYLFAQVVYTGFHSFNPVHAQARVVKDYLDARKIIRDRANRKSEYQCFSELAE